MSNSNGENKEIQADAELPEFKTEYYWAFVALMLYRLGGLEAISLEHLEQFDFENDCPQVTWDAKNKTFIMRNKDADAAKPVTIAIPGKIRKKMFREFVKNNLT